VKGPVASRKHLGKLHLLGSERELWFFVTDSAGFSKGDPTQMILCESMELL